MDLASSSRARRIGFGAWYLVQGIPWGYVAFALPALMARHGRGAEAISVVMVAATLPWALKPLVGALVDTYSVHPWGGRRVYALAAQAAMVPAIAALAWLQQGSAGPLATLILLIAALTAVQDVAADAIAVRLVPPAERAEINGIMHAAKYGGGFVGGALTAQLMARVAPAAGPLVMAALVGLLLLLLAPIAEAPSAAATRAWLPRRGGEPPLLRGLARTLRSEGWLPILLAFFTKLGISLRFAVLPALLAGPFGLSVADFSNIAGGIGLAALAAGALVGGRLADRVGRARVALCAGCLGAALTAGVGLHVELLATVPRAVLYYALQGAANGVYMAAMLGVFMGLAHRRLAATHFSLLMAAINIGMLAGVSLSGALVGVVGHGGCLLLSGALSLLAPALVGLVREQEQRAEMARLPAAR